MKAEQGEKVRAAWKSLWANSASRRKIAPASEREERLHPAGAKKEEEGSQPLWAKSEALSLNVTLDPFGKVPPIPLNEVQAASAIPPSHI